MLVLSHIKTFSFIYFLNVNTAKVVKYRWKVILCTLCNSNAMMLNTHLVI